MKFVSVIERIKGFDQDLFFLGLKTKVLNIETLRTKIKDNKTDITKSEPILHFQGKKEYCRFKDILCTFHSVVDKEIIMNGQITIQTFFH